LPRKGKRKLKCSGDFPACLRCAQQNLSCHYSVQKQMGRPRKRRKLADDAQVSLVVNAGTSETLISHENCPDQGHQSRLHAVDQILYPHPELGCISSNKPSSPFPSPLSLPLPPPESTLTSYPLDSDLASLGSRVDRVQGAVSPPSSSDPTTPPSLCTIAESFPSTQDWTEYFNAITAPEDVLHTHGVNTSPTNYFPVITSTPPAIDHYPPLDLATWLPPDPIAHAPSCNCLTDLYLALSRLSALPSDSINTGTVESLQSATRTAHTVLYCPICPQSLQSGVQNVMLLATLLMIIADRWSRILRAPPQLLAQGFSIDPAYALPTLLNPWTTAKDMEWKLFAHYLIRQYVFGDTPPPGIHIPGVCPFLSSSAPLPKPPLIILQNLCGAFERRQKARHGLIEATGEFPQPHSSAVAPWEHDCSEGHGLQLPNDTATEKREHLCLKIVDSVRTALASVDRKPDHGRRSWE
jgi:Fungal Zn(2)-Cys(6) binuclear cluster domain